MIEEYIAGQNKLLGFDIIISALCLSTLLHNYCMFPWLKDVTACHRMTFCLLIILACFRSALLTTTTTCCVNKSHKGHVVCIRNTTSKEPTDRPWFLVCMNNLVCTAQHLIQLFERMAIVCLSVCVCVCVVCNVLVFRQTYLFITGFAWTNTTLCNRYELCPLHIELCEC